MATQQQMDRLLGKVFFDADFRRAVLKDPEQAAASLRFHLTEAQANHIRRLDPYAMEQLAEQFAEGADWKPDSANFTIW